MNLEQKEFSDLISGLSRVATQNEEIIRRLNTQNGRVDRLEVMQWKLGVILAGTVGGIELVSKLLI